MFREADMGIYDAMNQALKNVRGEFVLFLNAGDALYDSEVLSRLAAAAQGHDAPSIFYCNVFDHEFQETRYYPDQVGAGFLYRRPLCHQAVYVRRSCFQEFGGFDSSFRILADHELLCRLVLTKGVACQHVEVVGVSYQGGGISASVATRKTKRREMGVVRQRHFGMAQRIIYGLLWHTTLPCLRIWLRKRFRHSFFSKWYSALANWIDRAFNKSITIK